MEYFKLSNKQLIPQVGMGTNSFGKVGQVSPGALSNDLNDYNMAIKNGYRLFDTAISYRNEALLGQAIRQSGIPRDQFYVISKIPVDPLYIETEEQMRKTVEYSLKELDLEYIDLYLIHKQITDERVLLKLWNVLEEYCDKGLLKAIGVSNFTTKQVEFLIKNGKVMPVVNQIKINSNNWNYELIKDMQKLKVLPQAYSPIKQLSDRAIELLTEIGKNYNKSWAQIIIRNHIENGINVVVKSHNDERQQQNINVFDFELSKEDKKLIDNLMKEEAVQS